MENEKEYMNIKEKEITVVIPVYNGEKSITETLKSICYQTALQYIKEIIVVNDGSQDNTSGVVREYSKESILPIRIIEKTNGGVSTARNRGMDLVTTPWIAFCDADDTWFPEKIEKQVKILHLYEMDLLGGSHRNKTLKILFRPIRDLYQGTVKDLCFTCFPQISTIVMKKRIYDEIGGFDENQRYAEDGNYLMKIAAKYRYFYDPLQVVNYSNGKRGFGQDGLTGNLKGMHDGCVKNLREMLKLRYIGSGIYIIAMAYEQVKYLRRIIISSLDSCSEK